MRLNILQFDALGYDEEKNAFFFSYDPTKFIEGRGKERRTVWSCVDRFRGSKDRTSSQWQIKKIDVTANMKKLFQDNSISLSGDILWQIEQRTDLSAKFFEDLLRNFDVILQIRNTGTTDRDSDFIHSPVEPFFDSRTYKDKLTEKDEDWNVLETQNSLPKPTSWDANGAYNIARKWLMMFHQRIKENPTKPDLFISDEEWDIRLQQNK